MAGRSFPPTLRRCWGATLAVVVFQAQHWAFCGLRSEDASMEQRSVSRDASFNFQRLRKLKKTRPFPKPAGPPAWQPPKRAPPPTAEEVMTMEFLEKINLCEEASEARKLLREMREKDLPPVMYAYHGALAVCANATAWQDAKELLQEMEKDRLTPDHTAYHYTMDAGRRGSGAPVDFAESLFKEMQMRGMMPTSDSYTKVIHAYLEQGNEEAATTFFREAVRQGLLQIWTNGGVFLQLYDYPTEVAVFILRLAITDRANELVGRKAGKRTIHVLTRQPEMPRNLPGQGLMESTVMGVLAEFGIKGRVEPSDFGRIRIRGEELERFGCELQGVPMKKKVRAR